MDNKVNIFYLLLFAPFIVSSQNWNARLSSKVEKAIVSTYNIERYTLDKIKGVDISKDKLPFLAEIKHGGLKIGGIYVGQAPSMKNVFDFILMFDNNWEIKNAKVLIYREQHGRQIGHPRWLKQFIGMKLSHSPQLGIDIDGLSGATISAKGMTASVREVLNKVENLLLAKSN